MTHTHARIVIAMCADRKGGMRKKSLTRNRVCFAVVVIVQSKWRPICGHTHTQARNHLLSIKCIQCVFESFMRSRSAQFNNVCTHTRTTNKPPPPPTWESYNIPGAPVPSVTLRAHANSSTGRHRSRQLRPKTDRQKYPNTESFWRTQNA